MIDKSDLFALKKVALDLSVSSIDLSSDIRMIEIELGLPETTSESLLDSVTEHMQHRNANTVILYQDLLEREKRCWESLIDRLTK